MFVIDPLTLLAKLDCLDVDTGIRTASTIQRPGELPKYTEKVDRDMESKGTLKERRADMMSLAGVQ
jgi:hypothetical protein